MSPCLYLITAPQELGEILGEKLLGEKLAACVQISAPVSSYYLWEGKVQKDLEVQLFLKSREDKLPELQAFLKKEHPYDVPQLIQVPITGGLEKYLAWINEALK